MTLDEPLIEGSGGSNNWSSGLFSIFDDLPILFYGTTIGQCMAIHNSVIVNNGLAMGDMDGSKISGPFGSTGCTPKDGAMCINCCIYCCFSPVYILWRGAVRTKFGIDGNIIGDCLAAWCCGTLAVMQDARELKARGLAYGGQRME
eukprot:TRINITY_DN61973_c0_g2_i1.p1 TRINITY_DN61973_c0_g2~~TRINITY_DN61973_c0_g2_i1.p1  ORF type:complete len:146 (-),score=6.51 TRINITY_DN61973_c0_g2_i1:582-1019(-)